MICTNPECPDVLEGGPAGEYGHHVVFCPRCGALLTAPDGSIPATATAEELIDGDVELVEVRAGIDEPELAIVRSILDGADIPYVIEADESRAGLGLGGVGTALYTPLGSVRLLVRAEDVEFAAALLTETEPPEDVGVEETA